MKILNAARLTLLSLLIVLPVSSTLAGDFSAVINGRSIHVDATEDWNENNFGLGLEYQFATQSRWKKQLMVNGFRDSSDEMSYMAGAGLHRTLFATDRLNGLYLDAGINAFLMTRKDVNDNRPFPGALPSLSLGNRHMGLNLTYLPVKAVERMFDTQMLDDTATGIFFLQLKVGVSQLFPAD
ncbi:MAG: hypothetical protein GY783_18865 [Gammaproteobacteria bacterium]|nr:hypothetical protein [Gammaproteobacteria bacterium]